MKIAATQYGTVTRGQAIEAGLSTQTIQRLLLEGIWSRQRPATYSLWTPRTTGDRWRQRLTAGALWLGDRAVVSHRAAGIVWELEGFHTAPFEFSTQNRRGSRANGLLIYRVSFLPDDQITTRAGFRLTSVSRTIVDLASVLKPNIVELALESALRRSLTSVDRVREVLAVTNPKQRGRADLRRLLDEFPGIPTGSRLEASFWQLVRSSNLPLPVRQYPIRDESGNIVARADAAYPALFIAIEVDGFDSHSKRRAFVEDRARQNRLTRLGWETYRYTSDDIESNGPQVIAEITGALARAPARLRRRNA
jgi:very-short-patch-repair endonuclease